LVLTFDIALDRPLEEGRVEQDDAFMISLMRIHTVSFDISLLTNYRTG
jgi:hypothetical protein